MSYTKGPWTLQDAYISEIAGQSEYIEPTIWAEQEDGQDKHIAVIRCGLEGSEANARLISAAPELLEALKRAAFHANLRGWNAEGEHELTEVYAKMQAAIAKAEL